MLISSAWKLAIILKCFNHSKIGRKERNECYFYHKFWSFQNGNGIRKVTQLGNITVCFAVWGTYLEDCFVFFNSVDSDLFCFSNTEK